MDYLIHKIFFSLVISGKYLSDSETCKINLFIEKKGNYQLKVNDKYRDLGQVHISKEENNLYINFGNISSLYTEDTIVFQNSGNSMNPYTHFEECDEKFIQLIKDLDSEGIKDTIFMRKEESRIISMPSSHKFEEIKIREIKVLN